MPVYNGEKYLREAIDSILNQTFTDFEFLIIDDGSTDNSLEIINSYQDPRINLIKNNDNQGLIYSLNRGLALAKGKYIARMDSDDISSPERLCVQIKFLDENPTIGLVGSSVQIIDNNKNHSSIVEFPLTHFIIQWSLCFYSPFAHPSTMIKKEILKQANGYSSQAVYVEDYDLWQRLSKITELSNLPQILLYLRKHDNNLTKVYLEKHIKNAASISQVAIEDILKKQIFYQLALNNFLQKTQTIEETYEVNQLILQLFKTFSQNKKIPKIELDKIKQDACERILNSLNFNMLKSNIFYTLILLIKIYILGIQIDHLIFVRLFIKKVQIALVKKSKDC